MKRRLTISFDILRFAVDRPGRLVRRIAKVVAAAALVWGPGAIAQTAPLVPAWVQQSPASHPSARDGAAMAVDSNGNLVLFGGYNASSLPNYLNDTWTWNGTSWTKQLPAHSPPARALAAIAYQQSTGQTVLFGGTYGNPLGDTWTWNGSDWTEQFPTASPGTRIQASLAPSANGQLVLFGGSSSSLSTDTWTWSGTNWTQESPAASPPARYGAAMAYFPGAKQTVLFGGAASNGGFLNDTWVWDGRSWTEQAPATTPSARAFVDMTYSTNSNQTLLFGGKGAAGSLDDTWSWNGTDWTQLAPVTNPPPRHATAIAATATDVVVFGGANQTPLDDTWNLHPDAGPQDAATPVLTSSPNPSTAGQTVTFTATVTGTAAAPTGSVSFLDGTSSIGTATLVPGSGSGSTATFATSSLAIGTHPITATYAATQNPAGPAHADTFAWTRWTLANPGNAAPGSAAGTLASSLYGTIDVSYSGQTSGLATQPSWRPASTFSGGIVGNAPPSYNGLALDGGYSYTETITFSHAVTDPAFAIWSLGSPSVPAYFNFTAAEPFNLLGGGPSNEYGGQSIVVAGTAIDGMEGNGIVQFIGSYSSLTFTTPDFEDYYALTVGEDQTLTDNPPISNVVSQVVNMGTATFGAMTFSPAATEPYGTNQIVTISDTLTYSGAQPTGAVTYVLNGVSYPASCTAAGSPETCSAAVPAATIASLPVSSYVVTGSLASDSNYLAATAVSGEFTVTPAGACTVPKTGTGSMNITYFTVAESDQDAGTLPNGGVNPNYVLPALGANGLPVSNVTVADGGPRDILSDGEITWWSPALNNGGADGSSDVVQTGEGVVSLPYTNNDFYPPNGIGQNDFNGYQAALLSSTLSVPAAETISFSVSSDDMAFVYLDGQIACDDGGIHAAGSVPCTTSVISAGVHSLELFYVDLNQVGAVLDFSVTTSDVSVGTAYQLSFGTMTFSPAATEQFGTSQTITIGDTVTYTGPRPTGAISFVLNGVSYAAACTNSGSPETCSATVPAATIAALPPNSYTVSGGVAGDCNYAGANATNGTFVVTLKPGTTELTLSASAITLTYGQTLALTGTATGTITGHAPTGIVSFTSGGAPLGASALATSPLNGSSTATYSFAPPVGTFLFDATYPGDTFNEAATAAPLSVTVNAAPTTTTLTSNVNPAPVGSTITFTISVQSGGGVPAGQVTLMDGTTVLSQMTLNAGTATYSTSSLAIGTHSLTASYRATLDYAASQGTLSQIVLNPPDFSIAASGPLTLVTEHHGPITIIVTPLNLFSGNVVLSCGNLPPFATCEWGASELTSTTVTVPSEPASTQLVIDTSAVLGYEASAANAERGAGGGWLPPAGLALSMMWLFSRRRRTIAGPLICLLLFSGLYLSGCSGKYPASTPPGTYTIDILGSSGTLHNTGELTLVVTKNPNGSADIR